MVPMNAIVVSVCDFVYTILLKLDRKKRRICHGQDTIDFGYRGLRDLPLEYELFPIVQQVIYDDMLIHITRLYLNDCRLTRLPDAVQELQFIQVLCLDSNYFRNIPPQVTSLQYLSVFYMNDNNLNSLKTSTLRKCPSLKSLWLEKNNLKSIPGDLHRLESLTYLHLVTFLPKLTILDLENNEITYLPRTISAMPELTSLLVDYNKILDMPELPKGIRKRCRPIKLETAEEIISKSPGKATVFLPWVKSVGSFHESFVRSPAEERIQERSNSIELELQKPAEEEIKGDILLAEEDKFEAETPLSDTSDFFTEAMERSQRRHSINDVGLTMTTEEWSDEILALQSIYEEIDVLSDKCIEINFKGEESSLEASLRVEIAADYPLHCPAVSVQAFFLQREEKSALIKELEDMFSSGEPIVFEWAEKVREILTLADGERAKKSREAASLEYQKSEKPAEKIEDPLISDIAIVAGETIIDRKSTFQPFYAKVNTVAEALRFREKLLQNRKIASATHNMFVYKVNENGIVKSDADEDGESGAEGRMLHLVDITGAMNIAVIVTRWYGGIHLGGDRWKHINNCLRQILEDNGQINRSKKP
ncbi:Oidioi.mRNA.OKI2018_I69.chr2.g5986.t1.cds [Oikopleura dioica]|uniref:Oidioi.mRNA.OKI2018_I69.chr2.g5986.t1.cds n=1 Tax=Oikopleura dioica TaxID=34765 RepID=A0ABN7T1N0_OIKDI|nr:Oidioi.mRNA.OKI2018_I69.chr2.g5986.t1.cds [Oikopleura dioica]